jgi:tetratricopeptide (TPR) repeat protein
LDRPFSAYRGTDTYLFVCYAHKDAESVYADMGEINEHGINLWYDEGITAGSSWRGEIAAAIKGAQKLIFFISESSLDSSHCLREVDYALNNDIEIVPVYLDDSSLPGELELVLNRVHALFRHTDSLYMQHLVSAVQETTALATLSSIAKKRKFSPGLALLAVGLLVVLAVFFMQRDGTKPGGQILESGLQTAPTAFDLYREGLKTVERWDKDDNLENAIALFREAAELDPGYALAYGRLADALRIRYKLTRDESLLEEAAENAEKGVRLNPGLAPVQVALARVHYTRGNVDLASAALSHALAIDPNNAEANEAKALVLQFQGRPQDADALFQQAVALNPNSLLIRDSYANFLYGQSRFEDASDQWQVLVRNAPDHYAGLLNLGTALSESGETAEAITMYYRAIEVRPSAMAYSNLGTAYSRAERYVDAIDAYRKALEIDDSDWLVWGNLAYVLSYEHGMDEEVIGIFEKAILLAEESREGNLRDPWAHSDLALYYAKTNKPELALQRVKAALSLSPQGGEIHAAAAEVYEMLGERDKAVELALKALELGFPRQNYQLSRELSDLLTDPRMQAL